MNFNGEYESTGGDISAGWYVFNSDGNLVDSLIFETFFNDFPIRVGADLQSKILYLPIRGRVQAYDMGTLELVDDTVVAERFSAVSWDPVSKWLVLSRRASDFTSPGRTVIYSPANDLVLADMVAGVNPAMAVFDRDDERGEDHIYALNEGGLGEGNSSLTRIAYASNIYGAVNKKELGGGGKEVLYDEAGGRTFILIPQAGIIRVLDATTQKELSYSPIELDDVTQPRALSVNRDDLWVSSWDQGLRKFSLGSNEEGAIKLPGKGEGIAQLNKRLFVAISYAKDSFDPDSTLVVLDSKTGEPIDTIVVGVNPISVFANGADSTIVVIGSGEEGKGEGWWKQINATTLETIASGPLPASASTPVQGAFDVASQTLAVIGGDTLYTIDLRTDTDILSPLYVGSNELFSHIANGDGHWLLTNYPGDFVPEPARLYAVEKETGRLTGSVVGGISVQLIPARAKPTAEGGFAFYLIPEQNAGGSNAPLIFGEYQPELFRGELGDGANHIVHERGYIDNKDTWITAVTLNGSHEVVRLSLDKAYEVVQRIPTGTSGFDGPRSAVLSPQSIYGNLLFVSTYSSNVIVISLEDWGDQPYPVDIDGKGEGMAMAGEYLYVANAFEKDTYNPSSLVSRIYVDLSDGVDDIQQIVSSVRSYPNPTSGDVLFAFTLEAPAHVGVILYDPLGRLIGEYVDREFEAGAHTVPVDLKSLPVGSYICRFSIDGVAISKTVEVVR
ncbi:MAG: T9SS type A sorting domain-containing protein [Ignavibacteriae bacterium]|nr:T9SS type A sorting domain-containing protein [Ignavibacteriota bacterium]MCB9214791.1 T9SS type A sorting domain-containing protein [Ignavibacteria bacterium]